MTPAQYNFAVVRGSAGPTQGLIVRLKVPNGSGGTVPMTFDDVRLSVWDKDTDKTGANMLFRVSIVDGGMAITDPAEAEVSWMVTSDDSRKLKVGPKNYYELEVRAGAEEAIYMLGIVEGIGGLNDDEAPS